jgi:beta-glucosidase
VHKGFGEFVTNYETQLCGIEKIHLTPGETKTVKSRHKPEELTLINKNMNKVVEPGTFRVLIGSSSVDIRLQEEFEITEGSSFCENLGCYGLPN